jgi:hypothetical protein
METWTTSDWFAEWLELARKAQDESEMPPEIPKSRLDWSPRKEAAPAGLVMA